MLMKLKIIKRRILGRLAQKMKRYEQFVSVPPDQSEQAPAAAGQGAPEDMAPTSPTLPSIWLITLPKSGSVFLTNTIAYGLGMRLFNDLATVSVINWGYSLTEERMKDFSQGGCVGFSHLVPSEWNARLLARSLHRCVLHVRDPRNAIVSSVHHLRLKKSEMIEIKSGIPLCSYDVVASHILNSVPMESQIDYMIENVLPVRLKWLEEWFDLLGIDFAKGRHAYASELAADNSSESGEIANTFFLDSEKLNKRFGGKYHDRLPRHGTKILLTCHEDLVKSGEHAFINRLLRFFDIPDDRFRHPMLKKDFDTTHFRVGRADGWKTEMSPEQKEKTTAMVPETWRRYFGWEGLESLL